VQKRQSADATASEPRASAAKPPATNKDAAAAANASAAPAPAPQASAAAGALRESADGDARRTRADWIARIRALRDAGNVAEARAELTRFRAAFEDADARLPADLREWATSPR
jgi:hypothetical protein